MDSVAVSHAADLTATRFHSFSEATRGVLEMLERQLPGSAVFVGHLDGDDQRFRIVDARGEASFDLEAGASIDLSESFCIRMAAGEAPNLSNDAASDPVYGSLETRDDLDIGSYAGVPLELGTGERIGSLCAIAHDLDAYSESDLQILRVLGSLLAFQLERDRAEKSLEELTRQLREQATTDALTGLLNRRSFDDFLEREFALTRRDGAPSHLLALDLDGFKAINDTLGHGAGDRALAAFAQALRDVARSTDVLARVGGDEFGVLLVRAKGDGAPERFVARVRDALRLGAGGVQVSFSAGHVPLAAAESPGAALEAADRAMYADKRARGADR